MKRLDAFCTSFMIGNEWLAEMLAIVVCGTLSSFTVSATQAGGSTERLVPFSVYKTHAQNVTFKHRLTKLFFLGNLPGERAGRRVSPVVCSNY